MSCERHFSKNTEELLNFRKVTAAEVQRVNLVDNKKPQTYYLRT